MTGRRALLNTALCVVTAVWYSLVPHLDLCLMSGPLPSKGFTCSCSRSCPSSCPCCSRAQSASEASSLCSCDDNSTESIEAGPAIPEDPGSPQATLIAVNRIGVLSQYPHSGHGPPIEKPPST